MDHRNCIKQLHSQIEKQNAQVIFLCTHSCKNSSSFKFSDACKVEFELAMIRLPSAKSIHESHFHQISYKLINQNQIPH